jgi:molybdenum cofactor biosynthesis enzyme MoaA
MLTGKGEPTLWPQLVNHYIQKCKNYFPIIELQTNGLSIVDGKITDDILRQWYYSGLTTIAISVAHWDKEQNAKIYRESGHFDLNAMIKKLQKIGFSVRISFVLSTFFNRSELGFALDAIDKFIEMAPDQITVMPVNRPSKKLVKANTPEAWVEKYHCNSYSIDELLNCLGSTGTLLLELAHGAKVFDYKNSNVCVSNCLSDNVNTDKSTMRNLIFHPDGHLRWDWTHEGSIIL